MNVAWDIRLRILSNRKKLCILNDIKMSSLLPQENYSTKYTRIFATFTKFKDSDKIGNSFEKYDKAALFPKC
jgi:hypothetical protein